jgi:hypothetical protein
LNYDLNTQNLKFFLKKGNILVLEIRMPRKRKNLGGNPFRKSADSKEVVVSSVASREDPTTTLPAMCETKIDQEELFTSISEMFSDLDPDVVYLMLSECDFKGEKKFSLNPLHLIRRLLVLCYDWY